MTAQSSKTEIHDAVAAYYTTKFETHGATPRGVDWKDHSSQRVRHRQFLRLLGEDFTGSVADVGCGYGDFLAFLREHGYLGLYTGYDIAPTIISAARSLHGFGADRTWAVGGYPAEPAAYVVASGIFNVKQNVPSAAWESYVFATIETMAQAAQRGFGFNVLSLHSDPERRRDDLFYADPIAFLDRMTRTYGRSVALLQDYGLFEFTLLVRV